MTTRFLRLPVVSERTGLSRSQIYSLISRGEFPAQIRLSERASAWLEEEIQEWCEARVAHSRGERV
jgi:prophage regulatory protein